ncbi:hypothetical protein PFICI_03748 [Pestalotiopsis fici W106-1]|uniref:Cell wall anchored protein n=1 Tax=Pestalotiopsis fici (strain W106-1 / CGMCC3.15140) TaxID=1229662 RepID=W3XI50_PESFW|nr:uncharacterized protein PFICI_03748 [Pestalotiopsis fici W106-1]ETS85723.1 hypothetical protein PFICI_03748 [Pestalotiopsis fici W106-1]
MGSASSSRQDSFWSTAPRGTLGTKRRHSLQSQQLPLIMMMVLFFFSSLSYAQRDPVNNFCRRFGHQSAVIDRKLYIDGGFINYSPLEDDPTNYTNTFLSYNDLDEIAAGGMPQLYSNLSKNATIPSVNGGVLWADTVNKYLFLYGGESTVSPPTEISLYSYDTLNNYWTSLNVPQSLASASYGAGVSVSEIGQAYYYGGWQSNASSPGWTGGRAATTGLIHYDMDAQRMDNMTGPDNTGRAEGSMVYLPVSDGGMLIYFGGSQDPGNGSVLGQPMDEIFIFDIASSRWYTQTASGDVPGMRARFCSGVTWADDQSSYNVYLYGGLGMPNYTSGYDDVYILSMPSFTWIKMYPNNTAEQYPHHSLTCNVIDGAQMIITGGEFPLDNTSCDAPTQFGAHGLDMGEQNADRSPWFLYRPNITSYVVPDVISNVIGGNAQGAATKTSPVDGFDEIDLKVLMARKYTAPARSPTRNVSTATVTVPPAAPSHSSSLSRGAIAGIAVGSAVGALAVLAGIWLCCRRRRDMMRDRQSTGGMSTVPALQHHHAHTNSGDGSLWSPVSSHQHSPYGTTSSPVFAHPQHFPPTAYIPDHPVEMPGNLHDSGASEMYDNSSAQRHSKIASVGDQSPIGGGGGVASPYPPPLSIPGGTDAVKHGGVARSWPTSPVGGDMDQVSPLRPSVYAGGGYGPQELSSETTPVSPRSATKGGHTHETFYHAS